MQSLALVAMFFQQVPIANSYWTDSNNDRAKEWVDDPDPANDPSWFDSDNDGDSMTNGQEASYGSDPYRLDSDFDGLSDKDEHDLTPLNDPWNWDSDGDGFSDHDAYYHGLQGTPLVVNYTALFAAGQAFSSYFDADGDGSPNQEDADPTNYDRDGDGILNWLDSYMDDPNNGTSPPDTTDSDSDGNPDYSDPFPWGSYFYNGQEYGGTSTDSDGDGIPDSAESFPNGSYTYGGTEYGGVFVDQDGDSIPDALDPFPSTAGSHVYGVTLYPGEFIDTDSDNIPDWADPYPNGSYIYNGQEYDGAWADQDGDSIPDAHDPFPAIAGSHTYLGNLYGGPWQDNDNDQIPDWADPFPNGSYFYNNLEYGGVWADQDNDGIPDPADPFPSLSGSYWYNGNTYGGAWIDSDNDGTPDPQDLFPNGSYWYNNVEYTAPWIDSDLDFIPDPADSFPNGSYWFNSVEYAGAWADSDNDAIPNAADPFPNGSYTYGGTEYGGVWSDSDNDTIPDAQDHFPNQVGSYFYNGTEYGGNWQDSDIDGVPDVADQWPNDAWNDTAHFTYNGSEYAGVWADYDMDSVPDPADSWPADPENGLDTDGDGLSNYAERTQHNTDPGDVDSDEDYLSDSEELLIYHTNPNLPISDAANGQTLLDGYAHFGADSDIDGLPDLIERHYQALGYGLSEANPADAAGDLDGDGVNNLQAYYQGWDLVAHIGQYDRDGDGITDVQEDAWSALYPGILDKTLFADAVADYDQDGAFNFEETNATGADPGNSRSLIPDLPDGPMDGQILAWRRDVDRADFTVSSYSNGYQTSGPAPAEYLTWNDSDPNGLPDGYEYWIANRLNGIPPPPVACLPVDQDEDGMSNEWEHRHHFHLRDPADAGPAVGMVAHSPAGNAPEQGAFINWEQYNAYRMFIEEQNALGFYTSVEPAWPTYGNVEAYNAAVTNYTAAVGEYTQAEVVDPDHDGLSNLREFILHSDPRVSDSDGDGFTDGIEAETGGNPLRRDSVPPLRLTVLGGNNQSTPLGQLPAPLVVLASKVGIPQPGISVSFIATSGTLSATPSGTGSGSLTVTTSGSGSALVYLSSPTSKGVRTITASAPGLAAITFTAIAVDATALIFQDNSLPDGTLGSPYTGRVWVTGGQGAYSWSISSGALPAGLTLSASGIISGTPVIHGGTSFITVQVADSFGHVASRSFTISISVPPLVFSPVSLPGGQANVAYSASVSATGGTGTGYVWSLLSGSLPQGINFSPSGVFSGTPIGSGSSFTMQVRDSENNSAAAYGSIYVTPEPALSIGGLSLPEGEIDIEYSGSAEATGGTDTGYIWSHAGGLLPPGITFNSSGVFAGTPTESGSFTFRIRVRDSANHFDEASVTIVVKVETTLEGRSSGVGGGDYYPANPGTPEREEERDVVVKDDRPLSKTGEPNLDEYNSYLNHQSLIYTSLSLDERLVPDGFFDANGDPTFITVYDWSVQKWKIIKQIVIIPAVPSSEASATNYSAYNEQVNLVSNVLETVNTLLEPAESIVARPNPRYNGNVSTHLSFDAGAVYEAERKSRQARGSASGQYEYAQARGDPYPSAQWTQFWIKANKAALADSTRTWLAVSSTTGQGGVPDVRYGVVTLKLLKGKEVSTAGAVTGNVGYVTVTNGVVTCAPEVPSTDGVTNSVSLLPIEVVVPDVIETEPPLLAGAGGGSSIADGESPPPVTSSNPPGSTPEPILFSLKPATELKVAKLEHSLNAQHQIEANKDHDCFYLQIPSFHIAGITHQKGDIKIKISTKGATDSPEHNDPAGSWIDLDPALGSDTWMTPAQLLVSDHGVDDLPTGQGTDYAADEEADDRTHVVELGGTVLIERVKILTDEFPLNIELPVKKKKEVSVRAVCMADQGINVSGAQHYLKIANERLAQVGVKLKVESVTPMAVPTNYMSDSSITAVIKPIGATKHTLGPEPKALVDTYKAQQFQAMTANDIVIFFCQRVKYPNNNPLSGQCVRGLATFDSYANATGPFGNSGFGPPTPSYANKIFISDEHRGIFTTAHEIVHCLSDHGHYQVDYNPDNLAAEHHKVSHNLMRRGTTPTEGIDGTKRIYKIQETLIFPTN